MLHVRETRLTWVCWPLKTAWSEPPLYNLQPLCLDLAQAGGLPAAKLSAPPSSSICLGRGRDRGRSFSPRLPRQIARETHTLRNRLGKEATSARKMGESLGLIGDKIEGLSIDQQTY